MINKYDITYIERNLESKPVFVFVNHKTAVLCWAKIKNFTNQESDVITFDSHGDFKYGLINGEDPLKSELYFRSKYTPNKTLKHFSENNEFLNWDLLNNEQNTRFIEKEKKFLVYCNDNFIDVAFMKNVVKNVHWYYLNLEGNTESGKCDDFMGNVHLFIRKEVSKFENPLKPFILDIDLDFYVKTPEFSTLLISEDKIKNYIRLQKELFSNQLCKGLTIALEPGCCGGEENCLKILKILCDEFKIDLLPDSENLIKIANN